MYIEIILEPDGQSIVKQTKILIDHPCLDNAKHFKNIHRGNMVCIMPPSGDDGLEYCITLSVDEITNLYNQIVK